MPAFPPYSFHYSSYGAPAYIPATVHALPLGPTLAPPITPASNSTPTFVAASVTAPTPTPAPAPAPALAPVPLSHVPSIAPTSTTPVLASFVALQTA